MVDGIISLEQNDDFAMGAPVLWVKYLLRGFGPCHSSRSEREAEEEHNHC
jgi:hypothetical protein